MGAELEEGSWGGVKRGRLHGIGVRADDLEMEDGCYDTLLSSHSVSFARALPRCEILFFSALGISAYVWPSYSKHASQPGQSVSSAAR